MATFRALYLANSMAQSSAYCSPHQNLPHGGKDKLTGATPIEGVDTHIPTPAVSGIYNFASVLTFNPAEQVFKYSNNDL